MSPHRLGWFGLLAGLLLLAPSASAQDDEELGVTTAPPDEEEGELGVSAGPEPDEELGVATAPEEAPADAADEAPADEAPADEAPADEAPADEAPADEEAAEENTTEETEPAEDFSDMERSTVEWSDDQILAWTTVGVSLGTTILGGVLLAVGIDDFSSIENAPGGTSWDAVAASYDRAPILTGTGMAVLLVGLAGTGIGAALLTIHAEHGTWIQATLGPGTLTLSGRF